VNAQLLIDAIVRQTTVLIAQLATSDGLRAPLAHLANRIFLELADELDAQGVSRRMGADMFGMALRAYLRKIQRLRESETSGGQTLWEAVYAFVCSSDVVTRRQVLEHFARDDEAMVRSALHDLGESGLVFSSGSGAEAVFRASTEAELGRMRQMREGPIDELVWVLIYREGPFDRAALDERFRPSTGALDSALARLAEDGRIETQTVEGRVQWVARRYAVPIGSSRGWEAAVLDHYQAMVKTICRKLRGGPVARAGDIVGGSTYTYEVWPGHPHEGDALGVLARFREAQGDLRDRIARHNLSVDLPDNRTRVVVYGGQCVIEEDENE
jgi:hypothetical protein